MTQVTVTASAHENDSQFHNYAVHACCSVVPCHFGASYGAVSPSSPSHSHNAMLKGESGNVMCPEGHYCSGGECFCYGGRVGANCDICK